MTRWFRGIAVGAALVLWGCPGLKDETKQPDSCTTTGQIDFVRDTMLDMYYWYKEIPTLDAKNYDSPEAYLEAIKYRPFDTSFSFITGKAENDAYYSESQFIGLGISQQQTSATEIRMAQVFPQSPASDAGLVRGDRLLAINGKAVPDLIRTGEINTVFGDSKIGVQVQLQWLTAQGSTRQATLTKREVTIPTVSVTEVYTTARHRVGYVFLRNFVTPSTAALDSAFGELQKQNVDSFILDVRYNGGGLVSVAQHLGGLIGGEPTKGKVFCEFFHNDKNQSKNSTLKFEDYPRSLDFSRAVVITTRGSASASESIINSLRPFMPVTVVGDTTYGKPVGQYGYDFCDKVLYPVAFSVKNARGEGDYFSGIPVDCAAADDLDHFLGDPAEASLAEALHYVEVGACSGKAASASAANRALRAKAPRPLATDGWRQLLNAW